MKQKELFICCMVSLGVFIIGLLFGYMLAMWGVYEILNHIHIESLIVDLNETQIVDYIMSNAQIQQYLK